MSDPTAFGVHRPRLFAIAYRMLGVRADAEDVVQDAWLRWQGADAGAMQSPQRIPRRHRQWRTGTVALRRRQAGVGAGLATDGTRITGIYVVRNPDKLAHIFH